LNLRTLTKLAFLKAGARSSEGALHYVSALFEYAELGWWLRRHGFSGGRRIGSCSRMPSTVAAQIGEQPVLYLQFGSEDEKMVTRWAAALAHPDTRLHVFDALDDRRGEWLPARGRGHWWATPHLTTADHAAAGATAAATDERIRFASGRLSDLLATYEWQSPSWVVAVFDTDHYATTKTALDFVADKLPTHTYLFFDQLNHRADELRAFHEFLLDSQLEFELFAANRELSCVAFKRIT
jgi:hypothetical protein